MIMWKVYGAINSVPAPVVHLFSKFPLEVYEAVDTIDVSLLNELNSRTYSFGCTVGANAESFTMLVDGDTLWEYEQTGVYLSSDPTSLFVQLALCYKNKLQLPSKYQEGSATPCKMVALQRVNLPGLMVKNRLITRDQVLDNLDAKFVGIERQLAHLIDKDLSLPGTQTHRVHNTILHLEKFIRNSNNTSVNPYLKFKITCHMVCMNHNNNSLMEFINNNCPHMMELAHSTLKNMLPSL